LVLIILIPSLIYFLFELSEVNFKKMAFYGPKTVDAKGDTVYYSVPKEALDFCEVYLDSDSSGSGTAFFTTPFKEKPVSSKEAFFMILLKPGTKQKLGGLLEYEKYKGEKLKRIPFMIAATDLRDLPGTDNAPGDRKLNYSEKYLKDSLGIRMPNFHFVFMMNELFWKKPQLDFNDDAYTKAFFSNKPGHVLGYFAVLVDKNKHIRGYYDPTYISEVKRMVEEYEHLVLKDEHAEMQKTNAIEKKQ
jgi:hypothetical protein